MKAAVLERYGVLVVREVEAPELSFSQINGLIERELGRGGRQRTRSRSARAMARIATIADLLVEARPSRRFGS